MKKILLFSLLLIVSTCIYSQEKETQKSKSLTVELLDKAGVLLKKEFFDIGTVNGITFQNLIITDLSNGKKTAALRIETSSYTYNVGTDSYIGTLDQDEIEGCLKSVKNMKESIFINPVTTYTECVYISKDGLNIGAFSKQNDWTLYVQPKRFISRSMKSLNANKVDELIMLLQKSLDHIKSIMQ